MSKAPIDEPDLTPASMHFQILLVGTVIFLAAFYSLTDWPHANSPASQAAAAASQLVIDIRILGCYLAFVSVVIGHGVLRRAATR